MNSNLESEFYIVMSTPFLGLEQGKLVKIWFLGKFVVPLRRYLSVYNENF